MTEKPEDASAPGTPEDRLESWKEIAAYLKRDVRTVQRWEKQEDLPIHRHVHNSLPTVYAYKKELDAWWNNRKPKLETERGGRKWVQRRALAAAIGFSLIGASVLVWWALSQQPGVATTPSVVMRKVPSPGKVVSGLPSSDGRFLPFVDIEAGDVWLYEFSTGERRRITHEGAWSDAGDQAFRSSLSPANDRIAYSWYNRDDDVWDIRLIDVSGGEPHIVYRDPSVEHIRFGGWARGGDTFVALLQHRDEKIQLVLLDLAGPAVRVLKTMSGLVPRGFRLSPDGRFVAYDLPDEKGVESRDIYVIATDGSGERKVVEHASNDFRPLWAPDGRAVIFASDRTGTLSIWSQAVLDGVPEREPDIIHKDLGRAVPVAVSNSGSLFYFLEIGLVNVYTAELDPESGAIVGEARSPSQRFVDSNLQPSWSPDSRLLAYMSRRGAVPGAGSWFLVIHSYESGAERLVAPELGVFNQPRWSADGRSIVVRGKDGDDDWGLHRIDAETGAFLETLPFSDARWSSDGKAVFFKGESGIYRYDPDTEQQSEIYRAERRMPIRFFDVSPDGRWLAFNQMASLRVMAADGGAPREIFRNSEEDSFATLRWSANGRELYFATGPEAKRATLWRLPAEGGEPQAVGIAMDGLRDLSVRPDGRSVAFTAGWPSTELWVMENFLPSPTLAAEDLR